MRVNTTDISFDFEKNRFNLNGTYKKNRPVRF